jgi:hypothetical protein
VAKTLQNSGKNVAKSGKIVAKTWQNSGKNLAK